MNREQKAEVIERLRANLDGVPAVVLTDFQGMTVEQTNDLRNRFREAGVHYEVVKNTLVRQAVAGTDKGDLCDHFRGNTAIAYLPDDPVAPARIVAEYGKTNDKLSIKAGWLDGKVLDVGGVKSLATLPGKDELRAQLLSVLVGAPTAFVRVLTAGPTSFARVLQARAEALG